MYAVFSLMQECCSICSRRSLVDDNNSSSLRAILESLTTKFDRSFFGHCWTPASRRTENKKKISNHDIQRQNKIDGEFGTIHQCGYAA